MENAIKEISLEEMVKAAGGQDGKYSYEQETMVDQILYIRRLAVWNKENGRTFQECVRELLEINWNTSNTLMNEADIYTTVREAYGIEW